MSLNINPLLPRTDSVLETDKLKPKVAENKSFEDVLKNAIQEVNRLQTDSDEKMGSLLKGESQDLHGTILAVQQADTSFKMMMQVRNRIVEAYREISRSGM